MSSSTSAGTTPADSIQQFSHQQILQVLSGVMLCILLAALDQTVVVPAVPAIAADLHGFDHVSWIVTAYLLTSTAATPIYGRLSDLYGRRLLLLPALVVFILASIGCALAGTLAELIGFRALQGLGGAGLVAMAQAAIADVIAPRERGRYQGYMASMWGVASIAGPIVGGYVTVNLSWRYVFWINLPLGLAAMWLSHRGLRSLRPRRQRARIDYLGALLLTGGITAWLLVLSWGGIQYPWFSPTIVLLGLAGAVLLVLLVQHERVAADPLLPPRLFRSGPFVGGVAIGFFAALALFEGTFLLPLFFQLTRGEDAGQSGLLLIPFLVSNVAGAMIGGRSARRFGRTKAIVLVGLASCGAGFAVLACLGPGSSNLVLVLAMLVAGIGIGILMPVVLTQVQNAAERRDVGIATACILFLRSMGGAFGTTIGGAIVAARFAAAMAGSGPALAAGSEHGPMQMLAGLSGPTRERALAALTSGFHLAFWVCAGLIAVALLIAARMDDLPLRSATGPQPVGH